MLEGIIGAALLVTAAAAGFLIPKFFGSYAAEKGKNLATREDIGRITAEIENVKAAIQTLALHAKEGVKCCPRAGCGSSACPVR